MPKNLPSLAELHAQIQALQQQAEEIRKYEFDEIVADIKQKIAMYGISAADLGFVTEPDTPRSRKSVPPRYRKGNQLWTGRGKQPKWVAEHIKGGGQLEDLLIK